MAETEGESLARQLGVRRAKFFLSPVNIIKTFLLIIDKGTKSNGENQFMEWTDEQICTAGSPIEN